MLKEILFLAVVFFSNVIQCITGFAGTVLAMPFSILLVGYDVAKPVLNVLALLASVYVVILCRRSIRKKELAKMCGGMAAGMAAGMALSRFFTGDPSLLYKTLGVIVIAFAVMNVVKMIRKKEEKELPTVVCFLLLATAGVVHGMFVCGGPLLVTYAGAKLRDKDEFRGTISATWILLNGVLFVSDCIGGYYTPQTVQLSLISAAVLAAALIVGNLIAKKLSREWFLRLTYALMLVSGVSLLVK